MALVFANYANFELSNISVKIKQYILLVIFYFNGCVKLTNFLSVFNFIEK